jgi:hypothetical protein
VSGSGGSQLTPDEEISLSLAEMNTLTAACQDAALCEAMLLAGLATLRGAQLEGKGASECMQAAVEAMLGVLEALPHFIGTLMESPLEHQQEQGALSMAGWAATQLSLRKNRRLRHALEQDGSPSKQSPYAAFLAQLHGAVHLAYYTDPDASLDALLTNTTHVLEPGASRVQRQKPWPGSVCWGRCTMASDTPVPVPQRCVVEPADLFACPTCGVWQWWLGLVQSRWAQGGKGKT